MDNQEERDCNSYLATDPKELERQILDSNVPKNEREWWAKRRIEDLIDFAIWMTGCGYDFTQHSYFCERRDKLLKLPLSSDSSEKLYPDTFRVNLRKKSYNEYVEALWEVYQKGVNEIPCDNDDLKRELFLGIVTEALSQIIDKMDVKAAYSKAPRSVASVVPVVME